MDKHAHVRECTQTNVWSITLCFLSLHDRGMERLDLCCNNSWVFFVFFLYLHPWLWPKKTKLNENKINRKHTKIHNIVLHLADGQYIYIFSVLLVVFVTSIYVTPLILSAGVWKLGCGCRAQVQPPLVSYIQYHKTLSHYKSHNPSVSGPFTFFLFCFVVVCLQTVPLKVGEKRSH